MEKLSGANFSLWKSQMEDILILKDQYLPIEGTTKKPSSMTNEEWNKLDRKAIATIRQYLAKNVYFNVSGEKTQKDYGRSSMIYMRRTRHQTKCS
jgi:hypothetical protein